MKWGIYMSKTYWKCALIGGLIVFIWGIVSWMLLPWHMMTTHKFINEEQVAMAIKANAPEDGIYFLPSCHPNSFQNKDYSSMSKEEKQEAKEEAKQKMQGDMTIAKERMKRGPILFASVHLGGMDPSSVRPFIGSLIIQIISAFFATWLFLRTRAMSYARQVGWFAILGLFAGVVSALPAWNWMCFSAGWTIVTILDLVIGWVLAGLAIAKIARR